MEDAPEDDYIGVYIDEVDEPPKKKRVYPTFLTHSDLLRLRREIEEDDEYDVEEDEDVDEEYPAYDERRRRRRRRKRQEQEPPERERCNSEITTLTVGCSTADRMEFQSDCVDEDFVTGGCLYTTPALTA